MQLRERRFPQFVVGYLAAGWLVLQLIDQLVGNAILPGGAYRVALVTYLLGIPAVAALAWFHGKPGRQAITRTERALIVSIVVIWIVASAIAVRAGGPEVIQVAGPPKASPATSERIGGTFLIVPFRNLSGSPEHEWLVDGSPSLLADILGHWREVSVIPPERMYAAVQQQNPPAGAPLGTDLLQKVAKKTGATSIVAGEVLRAGTELTIVARVYEAGTGRVVIDAREPVAPGEDVRAAYERVGIRLLRAAGLQVATTDLRAVTTQSLEAYKVYAAGIAHLQKGERTRAERAFRSAVELDSTFAQAWARLATVTLYDVQHLFDRRAPTFRYAARAVELAARLPERQRRYVQALYETSRGNFTAGRRELEALVGADSADIDAVHALMELEFTDPMMVGTGAAERPRASFTRAVALGERVLRLDPSRHGVYGLMSTLYTRLADPRAARNLPPSATIFAFRTEQESLFDFLEQMPDKIFRVVLRDTIEFVEASRLPGWSQAALDAANARAKSRARTWVDRWLAVAPRSSAAHLAGSRLAALDHDIAGAAAAQQAAEALSTEEELTPLAIQRVAVRARQRRFRDALALADSLRGAGFFDQLNVALLQSEGLGYAYALYLMKADSAGAQTLLRTMGKTMRGFIPTMVAQGMVTAPKNENEAVELAQYISISVLASSKQGDMKQGRFPSPGAAPPAMLFEALDSLIAHPARIPGAGMMLATIPAVFDYAAFAADPVSAKRAAARALELADIIATRHTERVEIARELADYALKVDPSLQARADKLSWFQRK